MSSVRMDFAGVESLATAITGHAEQALAEVGRLANQADPSAVWEGTAAVSYRNAFDRWKKAQQEAQDALRGLANAVNTIKNNFAEINNQGGASFDHFFS